MPVECPANGQGKLIKQPGNMPIEMNEARRSVSQEGADYAAEWESSRSPVKFVVSRSCLPPIRRPPSTSSSTFGIKTTGYVIPESNCKPRTVSIVSGFSFGLTSVNDHQYSTAHTISAPMPCRVEVSTTSNNYRCRCLRASASRPCYQ